MPRSLRLRPWQKAALERFGECEGPDFLAVATPGAGKTTFALAAAASWLHRHPGRLVVVAPTAHLKIQWARAAAALGFHLDPSWSAADGTLPADMHGIVTTYQQVATSAPVLSGLCRGAMVIFDEIHHAGDDRAWGQSVRHAFEGAARRLALSGTPFRSDTRAIPFVRYEMDEAVPDYEYGYGDALAERRVVRPVFFPRTGGDMEWSAPDGSLYSASFDDPLTANLANQRLRTALSLEGDWLATVLRSANDRLVELRRHHPSAGGLVIAIDQDHARGIADQLSWRFGVRAVVATSDDAGASDRIAAFRESDQPWLVAVRMVSEGVDIPRLRVGVYATTTTTELFFRQAVGRLVRWVPGIPNQRSYLYIPDDPRLRARAFQIADARRHSLRRDTRPDAALEEAEGDLEPLEGAGEGEEQLSLFAAISAVATKTEATPVPGLAEGEEGEHFDDDDPSLMVELQAPLLAPGAPVGSDGMALTRRELKNKLREENAFAASDLARATGWSHAQVNAELNRLTGIKRVTEATVAQLEARLKHAERWRRRL
ncbi:MAG TPA: DEAD/DEAH box helicase [Acidimicrobiales bacterium]|nr:DEAD/DEAH box helicase [Acidimicrobiales bacterium]